MPITIEEYHSLSAKDRKKVNKEDLRLMLDEHLSNDGNIASIRGIIREELDTKFKVMKDELSASLKAQIKTLSDENKRIAQENTLMKKVLQEHQKANERAQREETKNRGRGYLPK